MSASNITIPLPNAEPLLVVAYYTSKEQHGVTFLIVVSTLSLIACVGLLGVISLSAFNTRSWRDEHLFVRTHVAAYFISLLLCDFMQAIGSLLNGRWVNLGAVILDSHCTAQGVFKMAADVGAAIWTLVIALHTFFLLVLEVKPNRFTLAMVLLAGWSAICMLVIAGPAVLDTVQRGAFFGISGYWCWIAEGYDTPRITLDYMLMFLAAFLSFVIYTLIFLRLRGNMVMKGWRMRFSRYPILDDKPSRGGLLLEDKGMSIAKQMLLYPIAYSIIILPIAVSRFSAWTGHKVSFEATVFCETIYLLSGCVDVTLFCTTRQILPPESVVLLKRSISKPKALDPVEPPSESGSDPYYDQSLTVVGYGFSDKWKDHQDDPEKYLEGSSKSMSSNKREANTNSVSLSDGSSGVSVPYEHTVAPLQINRKKSRRPPTLPPVKIPDPRMSLSGSEYSSGSSYGPKTSAQFNDVSLETSKVPASR